MSEPDPVLCFIDTNIWLYAFIQTQDRNKTTVAKATIQHSEIVISPQVVNEVCVNLIKKARFDEASIRDLIDSFYSQYQIAEISRATLVEASRLRERYQFSYGDSLIIAAALLAGATIIYSEDMHRALIVESRLQIINPFAA